MLIISDDDCLIKILDLIELESCQHLIQYLFVPDILAAKWDKKIDFQELNIFGFKGAEVEKAIAIKRENQHLTTCQCFSIIAAQQRKYNKILISNDRNFQRSALRYKLKVLNFSLLIDFLYKERLISRKDRDEFSFSVAN